MGEYIDIGIQNSIIPLTLILSSVVIGVFALFGVETENDDDDSDSGSGGLMQPIWYYLYPEPFVVLLKILNNLNKQPKNNIKEIINEIKIKNTTNKSYRLKSMSIIKPKILVKDVGIFCRSVLLLGIK